jgi:aminopeptidase N
MYFDVLVIFEDGTRKKQSLELLPKRVSNLPSAFVDKKPVAIIPNYQDYGYGIFLLDSQSRDYVLKNIDSEKDDFLRSMMWGALWDSVREAELNPKDYVELAIKNIAVETDELTIQTILSRVSTAMNYYLKSEPPAAAGGLTRPTRNVSKNSNVANAKLQPSATADGSDLLARLENLLIEKMRNAPTLGQRITFYRAFLNVAASEKGRAVLKDISSGKFEIKDWKLKTKDKFDIVTKLAVLGDADAPKLLADLQKTETSDDAKRYAYAAGAGFGTAKEKYFNDFLNNKGISESWIEAAFVPFNAVRHSELTMPYLEKALAELPNLKRSRKIFFVNGWLGAFIGGQKDEKALAAVNKFLADNPKLDKDLRLKILENLDGLERAVKLRQKW